MYGGFDDRFILENGNAPRNDSAFAARMTQSLDELGGATKNAKLPSVFEQTFIDAVHDAKKRKKMPHGGKDSWFDRRGGKHVNEVAKSFHDLGGVGTRRTFISHVYV